MNPDYTRYHPKWHRDRMPIFWWLRRLVFTRFIARELTSVFVAYAAVLLLVEYGAVRAGPGVHSRLEAWLATPAALALHGAVLVALLFHAVTWLHLAPKALAVHLAGRRLPAGVVLAGHYAAWLGATALVAWLLLGR